jgi:signal transduction histidine kinase
MLALGEDLPVGIWVARAPHGELIYANRMGTSILGMGAGHDGTAGGEAGRSGVYTRDGAPYPRDKLPFVRALAERCVIIADDLAIRNDDGSRSAIRAVARPVGDPITHVIVALFDVSREVAAEAARAEAEKRLRRIERLEATGTLAAGIAHDFNNLIFTIKLIVAELAATEQHPQRQRSLGMIDEVVERSGALTRSLLGFIRRGATHPPMPVGVNDIVTSLTELWGRTLPGVALRFELDAADRGTVVGDPAQLEQMIMDLVLGACDAARGAGRVVVRTTTRTSPSDPDAPRSVALEVKDDGTARPPEDGTGLDLSSVSRIVEGHGGVVEVDIGLDGRGTTMRVVLPAAPRAPAGKAPTPAADPPRGTDGDLILIVDDDQMVRKVVAGSLGSLGYKTLEAIGGAQAIEIYRVHHHDIRAVVLDMTMAGMSGKATYLALREINHHVAVLLMSGHTLNEQVQGILDLGVRGFLTKPYSLAELAAALAELAR